MPRKAKPRIEEPPTKPKRKYTRKPGAAPRSPYLRLLDQFIDFERKIVSAKRTIMFTFRRDNLISSRYSLWDVAERVRAADQLGYDTKMEYSDERGLQIWYVERIQLPDRIQKV